MEPSENTDRYDIPLGFGMALAQNMQALERFAMLAEAQQRQMIEATRQIRSKEEMREYVNHLVTDVPRTE